MKSVKEVAADLQKVTEEINPLIERAERLFQSRKYEVAAGVDLPGHDKMLLFFPEEGRLAVQHRFAGGHRMGPQLLVTTSRAIRLEALKAFPALVAQLDEARVWTNDRVESVLARATAYLDGLESR
jgi:hypothetical protein